MGVAISPIQTAYAEAPPHSSVCDIVTCTRRWEELGTVICQVLDTDDVSLVFFEEADVRCG